MEIRPRPDYTIDSCAFRRDCSSRFHLQMDTMGPDKIATHEIRFDARHTLLEHVSFFRFRHGHQDLALLAGPYADGHRFFSETSEGINALYDN